LKGDPKMKKLLIVMVVVVAASTLASGARNANARRGDPSAEKRIEQMRRGLSGNGQLPCLNGPLGPGGPQMGLWMLDLTEEQQALIAEIRENARIDAEAADTPEARREIMQAAHEEILAVLTDEQIEKLEQVHERMRRGRGGFAGWYMSGGSCCLYEDPESFTRICAALELTEEQQALIAEIRENACIDAEAAETPEARREIMQAAHEEILAVLTDEQIERLEQVHERMRRGRGGFGGWNIGMGPYGPGTGRMGIGPHGPGDGLGGIMWMLRVLDLTEEQKLLIEEILEVARPEMEVAREAVAEAAETLHEAVIEGATEDVIREAATVLGIAIGDEAVLKVSVITSIKSVLTEEQLVELEEIKSRLK
jgi:Spy/CpxP family protein refolding chaperone